MTTIKTQVTGGARKVITKVVGGQKMVSCSCCEEEGACCMYPAQALNEEALTYQDLPEQVEVFVDAGESVFMQRIDPPIQEYGIVVYYEEIGNGYSEGENYIYRGEGEESYTVFLGGEIFYASCLFTNPEDFRVQDAFADAYNWSNGESGSIERTSLCRWQGIGRLYYYDGDDSSVEAFYNGPPHRWVFIREGLQQEEGGGLWEKTDPQNGPEGTYVPSSNFAGSFFSGLGTVTITEA